MKKPADISDKQLWEQLRQGNEDALSQLFLRHVDQLYHYGYMLCRDKQMTEDCIQNIFLDIWRKRNKISNVDKVQTYLLSALHNRILDSYRKKSYRVTHSLQEDLLPERDFSAEHHWIENENRVLHKQVLEHAVNALPARMKQAIYLRYFEGFEYADIARVMDISQQVAINMVYRATQKLRTLSRNYSELFYLLVFWLS